MKVDLERLRRSLARYVHAEENSLPVGLGELEALLAVVDAAREADGFLADPDGDPVQSLNLARLALRAALEPFTPRPDRAWEEVDRWNAERDLAVKAAVDATKPNPRDRARDQLADAGVVVQRQFRSDQERIAELERERDLLLYSESGAERERDALKKELAEARAVIDWGKP